MNTITVSLQDRSYDVIIGSDLLQNMQSLVQQVYQTIDCFFVLDQNIEATYGQIAVQSFGDGVKSFVLKAIESNKTMQSVESIWDAMLKDGYDRHGLVVAVGGGLTGDVGGFAAATYLRGVPVVQVPTTLLAMVDASIGGKTGINVPIVQKDGGVLLGKNLAGSFWQPALVIADVSTLKTLDDRQLRCGLAECVKHGMLGHQDVFTFIQQQSEGIFARDVDTLLTLVSQSVAIKSKVVAQDEREQGRRALLNLGHTFAHAIEPMSALHLFHGEAVSIGLCAACSCSEALGLIDAEYSDNIRSLLTGIGLPTRLPMPIQLEDAMALMAKDKKAVRSQIRLVLPTQDGAAVIDDIDDGAIALAWASVGATS